jgi:hypothetical protein
MIRILVACAALGLAAAPVLAASPKVEAAVKTFNEIAADSGKLKTYCDMTKAMDALGDKEDAAAEAKIDGYMKQLGPNFETAWNSGEGLDDTTADGKAFGDALDKLSAKCPN